jgi:Flp pilus assembly protein TadG
VAVIFAALLPAFVGMIALSVDLAAMSVAKGQIETTADAAALAGARCLFTDNHLVAGASMSAEIAAAQSGATSVAAGNRILGGAPVVLPNASNLASGDIVVGYFNSAATPAFTTSVSTSLYNAVQVRIARDSTHGGVVPALFGGLMGSHGTSLSATSIALAQNYQVGGFSTGTALNANILPIALDQTTYNAMIAGNPNHSTTSGMPTDQYAYNASTGAVTSGSDGLYESKLYPVSNGSPGNWGTVKIGVSNNGTSTLGAQIRYGITPDQLSAWAATFSGQKIQFSTSTNPPSLPLGGNPGISAGIKSDLDAIIGQTRLIPIYSAVTGNGNNTSYTIVKFAGVRLLASNFQGNPKYVIVQPALVNDATAVAGTPPVPETSWSSGGLVSLGLVR